MGRGKQKKKKNIIAASRIKPKASHILLFIISCVFTTVYLGWRAFFTLPLEYGATALILGVLLLIAELMAALELMVQFRQINKRMIPEMPEIPDDWFPEVDIFIATHNESTELLHKTVNACTFLHYPDKSKVHVYLCDDNNRPEMAELAAKLNVGYFGLTGNKHAKAGNLNNALKQTHSQLVVTFDSDMIPTSDFLLKTVPYFFIPQLKKDPVSGRWVQREADEIDPDFKIGFIQTPQSFYNPDLFQFNLFSETRIPNEQDFFFREVNVGRNADNGVIYAGSNTVLSREALEAVNYIAVGSITEDFLTGLRMQKKGYTTYAIPDELAHGLAPNTVSSLLKQRERWGRGCIQALMKENILFTRRLSIWTKLSYLATWSYWWTFARRFIYIISPVVTILFNLPVMDVVTWQVITFWVPHYLLTNAALKSFSNGVRNRHWSNVYDTIMFPYLILPIIMETVGIKQRKFVVTDKERVKPKRNLSIFFVLPHVELLLASLLALIVCVRLSIITNSFYSPIIFFWLCMNIKNIVFSVFFMYGRENYRMAERNYVRVPVEITCFDVVTGAYTSDISETGLAVFLDKPLYIPPDKPTALQIKYSEYAASMFVNIVHVVRVDDQWKYSMRIAEIDYENFNQYMQIVYDRSHTMPRQLDATLSIFDDFNINFINKRTESKTSGPLQQSRYKKRDASMRALPRIRMDIPFKLDDGGEGIIVDFNYEYIMLRHNTPRPVLAEGEQLKLDIKPGFTLFLEALSDEVENDNGLLYRVTNAEEIATSPNIDEILSLLLNSGEKQATAAVIPVRHTYQFA